MILSRPHNYRDNRDSVTAHSVRSDFTGLAIAAFIAWKLTVNSATNKVHRPAMTNTDQWIFILYAKSSSHLFMKYQATGNAMIEATRVSFRKSFDNNATTFGTEAPKTFRTPISFVLFSAINALRPNKPRQAMKIENAANMLNILPSLCSERYCASNASSKKL